MSEKKVENDQPREGSWTTPPCSCYTGPPHWMECSCGPTTEAEIDGLTHTCTDPECHVPGFVETLRRRADEQRARPEPPTDPQPTSTTDESAAAVAEGVGVDE